METVFLDLEFDLVVVDLVERVGYRVPEEQPEGIFPGLTGSKIGFNPCAPGSL